MRFRFVELPAFTRDLAAHDIGDDTLRALQVTLMGDPRAGAVMPGTNGVRKVRFAAEGENRGKSGSYRACYIAFLGHGVCLMIAVLAKNERANLTKAERNALAKLVGEYQLALGEGNG